MFRITKLLFSATLYLFANSLFSQSSSVFDASYFKTASGEEAPVRIGKGFDISDVFRQTRYCFTEDSRSLHKLEGQQNAKTTNISVFYTKTAEEFNSLLSGKKSGKVSFLNLFSIGGDQATATSNGTKKIQERIIVQAKVDFGRIEFPFDPELTPEAKTLIEEGQYDKFISLFGTHYVSGVKKEASLFVILKRDNELSSNSKEKATGIEITTPLPLEAKGNFQVEDQATINNLLEQEDFTVEIYIEGPSLEKSGLENSVSQILAGQQDEKFSKIKKVVSEAVAEISDPREGKITQYYISPFSLYQVEGIIWNKNKENLLCGINEVVLRLQKAEANANSYLAPNYLNSTQSFSQEIEKYNGGKQWKEDYLKLYHSLTPEIKKLLGECQAAYNKLEAVFSSCSEIHCDPNDQCCTFSEIENVGNVTANKLESLLARLEAQEWEAYKLVLKGIEDSKPECEKLAYGFIAIENHSYNPYRIFINGNDQGSLEGKKTVRLRAELGSYTIKAEQISGYLFYATVNNRSAEISTPCQVVTLKVGFED